MIIGVPKEIKLQEHRIGLTPDSVKVLTQAGHKVLIEKDGGFEAGFANEDYMSAGANLIKNAGEIFSKSEIIVLLSSPYFSFSTANSSFIMDKTLEESDKIEDNSVIVTLSSSNSFLLSSASCLES